MQILIHSPESISPDRFPHGILVFLRVWRLNRGLLIVLMNALLTVLLLSHPAVQAQVSIQGVVEARQNVLSQDLILIDVRRPEEWADTGIADVATEIDMRSPDFLRRIRDLQDAYPDKKIGFICAVGSRSAGLARWFVRQGQVNIVDVNAGMIGRDGWLANGLPVRSAPGTHPSSN